MRTAAIVPAYQAEPKIGEVVRELVRIWPERVWVVDDGSTDATAAEAERAGATVLRHASIAAKARRSGPACARLSSTDFTRR